MLTIYSTHITDRISYIMNIVFNEHLQIPYLLTDSIEIFNQAEHKISYAIQPIDNEIFIWQHPLMIEDDIKAQTIEPFLFEGENVFFQSPVKESFLPFDLFAFSFYLLTRYEEYLPYKKDRYERFQGIESIAYKLGFLQKPLIDILVLRFVEKLKTAIPNLDYNTGKFKYIASYDIDNAYAYKYKGFIQTIGGLLKSLYRFNIKEIANRINVLFNKKKDPFDTYGYTSELSKKHNISNIYFILFSEKGKYDRNLNPQNKKFQMLINQLNLEIGRAHV